jgi:hypothetical protein
LFQFVEAEGDIVFYKNAQGLAAARPKLIDTSVSDGHDSGVEIPEKDLFSTPERPRAS